MRILPAAFALSAALALAQGNRGTFRNGDVTLLGSLRSGKLLSGGGVSFDLYGGVSMTATKIGLKVTADSVKGETLSRKLKTSTALRRAELIGNVVATRVEAGETTVLKGSRADYDSPDGENATLALTGPVSITNNGAEGRSLLATGTRGSAILGPKAGGGSAIRSAALAGDVKITLDQAPDKAGAPPARYTATGDRAVLDYGANGSTINLTGDVKLSGTGENFFDVSQVKRVTITINAKGEATGINFDGDGADTKTVVKPGAKKKG